MKNFLYLLIGILIFTSCEDVIDVALDETDQDFYTVEAYINTIREPWAFVSKTVPVTVDEPQSGLSDALVVLTDDATPANQITLVEKENEPGFYTVPENESFLGVPGRTYTLTITTPENITLTATETLYPVAPIDSIQIYPSNRGDEIFLGVFTFGADPEGLGDLYKWDIFINGELLHEAEYMFIVNDDWVDGSYVAANEIFTDFHDPTNEDERMLKFGDTVHVEQCSITPFAYDFYLQMINQSGTGFLFSVPPANIQSNITASDGKDVYGLFSAQDKSVSNTVIIDESIENQLVKIN